MESLKNGKCVLERPWTFCSKKGTNPVSSKYPWFKCYPPLIKANYHMSYSETTDDQFEQKANAKMLKICVDWKPVVMKILEYNDKRGAGDPPDQAYRFPVEKDLLDDTVTSPVPILFHPVEPKKYQYIILYFHFINISACCLVQESVSCWRSYPIYETITWGRYQVMILRD